MKKDDLTEWQFASLIGYEKKVFWKMQRISQEKTLPNITRGVDRVLLNCDIITQAVNDEGSDVLYSLSIIDRQVKEEPFRFE